MAVDVTPSQRSKDHHTVPQFILRNFVDPVGDVHVFDLKFLKHYRKKPQQIAKLPDFYTIDTENGPSDAVEKVLSMIEREASKVIRRLATPEVSLTWKEQEDLVLFFALQLERVPFRREDITGAISRVEDVAMNACKCHGVNSVDALSNLRDEMAFLTSRNFLNSFLIKSTYTVYLLIRRRGWGIMRRPDDGPRFVISDNPIVITDLRENMDQLGFLLTPCGEDSVLTMPICPDFALVSYFDPKLSTETYLPAELISHCNLNQLRNSSQRLYGSEEDFTWTGRGERELGWSDFVAGHTKARAD